MGVEGTFNKRMVKTILAIFGIFYLCEKAFDWLMNKLF